MVLLPRPLVALSPERTPPDNGTSVSVCVCVCTCVRACVCAYKKGSKIVKWEAFKGDLEGGTHHSHSQFPLLLELYEQWFSYRDLHLSLWLPCLQNEHHLMMGHLCVCVCVCVCVCERERERGSEIVKWVRVCVHVCVHIRKGVK